jgi:isoleucyl-tRNA synthetase
VVAGGHFTADVEHFAGQKVFEANPRVVALLQERGALIASGKDTHSYPLCWRCHHPVIFRATEQWFIAMDVDGFRERALEAIGSVRWYPAWGEERIRNMIAARPDWCISRQRLWGVPIPAFYCTACGEAILTADLTRHVAALVEQGSADVWYEREAADLLPQAFQCPRCRGTAFSKETDILDVWFDSGSSYAAARVARPEFPDQADVYLEGSDQHRGWFHSSLLIGVATQGKPPYKQVITHGFTVDGEGRKMSKSLGNVVDPLKIVANNGAEILRLWVAMVDYREDMRISEEMIKRLGEAYRKIRNTCRYLLANLFDFDPKTDTVAENALEEIDRFALARHRQVVHRILAAYESYELHVVYHQLVQYCAADLSAFYFDVLKDRLYCDAAKGPRRLSCQTALYRIASDLTRLMAPVLPMTADEVWQLFPSASGTSVHLERFPADEPADNALLATWDALATTRSLVTKAIEHARAAGQIASSLEARVRLSGAESELAPLRRYEQDGHVFPGNLANLFIVSRVELLAADGALSLDVARAPGLKCERCWTYFEGDPRVAPRLCPRCGAALETR